MIVDVTGSPVQRPKKGQKEYYSGKKRHTIKTQVIIEKERKTIIDVRQAEGSAHDFKLYKDAIGKNVDESIMMQTDLGCLGIENFMKTA